MILGYGLMLAQGEDQALAQIPGQLALLAEELFGIEVDPEMIGNVINLAMAACKDDCDNAIDKTIRRVRAQMALHGFGY